MSQQDGTETTPGRSTTADGHLEKTRKAITEAAESLRVRREDGIARGENWYLHVRPAGTTARELAAAKTTAAGRWPKEVEDYFRTLPKMTGILMTPRDPQRRNEEFLSRLKQRMKERAEKA